MRVLALRRWMWCAAAFAYAAWWMSTAACAQQSAPAAAAAASDQPPARNARPSYARLADPEIVRRLQLSDAQQAQVRDLIDSRNDSLRRGQPEERSNIMARSEAQLESVLTVEQRAVWNGLWQTEEAPAAQPADKRLRFSFRFQPWADVLEWFADNADLSLVLDAPPPGTFNYSDNKEYTVPEAIDLLNGVLATKGYTLLRRERMLMLVNVAEGIPPQLIPQVQLDELDERGRFELVTLMLPIGDRNPEEVEAEIKPLLGPNGNVSVLAKTKQILVTETAGKMRAIHALVESIPIPKQPAPAQTPGQPPSPVLRVYPLAAADAEAALAVLKAILPDTAVAHDPKTSQLVVFAVPEQQEAVSETLVQMQADVPEDQRPRLEVYELRDAAPASLLELLQTVAPGARVVVDPAGGKLIAWATAAQQQLVEDTIANLGHGGGDATIAAYRVPGADPSATLAMLQSLAPQARLTLDGPTGRIIALARADDHRTIATALEQLGEEAPAADRRVLTVYALKPADWAILQPMLADALPQARLAYEAANRRLLVMARPAEQLQVRSTVEQITAAPTSENLRSLEVYSLPPDQRRKVSAVLEALGAELDDMRVVSEPDSGELAIWATAEQHARVRQIIEQLHVATTNDSARRLVAYTVTNADITTVQQVLQTLLPDVRFVAETKTRQLVAWAAPSEHELIRATVDQMDRPLPDGLRRELRAHPVGGADATAVVTMLHSLLPEVEVVQDAKARTLAAWAAAADHETISETIRAMQPGGSGEEGARIVVYPTGDTDPAQLSELLAQLIPDARLAANSSRRNLAVWATPEQHEIVAGVVERMRQDGAEETRASLRRYQLRTASSDSVRQALAVVAPEARTLVDANTGDLIVWARPWEQAGIAATIEQLDAEDRPDSRQEMKVHPLDDLPAASVLEVLQTAHPRAKFMTDAESRRLIVWASAEDHEKIQGTLDELRSQISRDEPTTEVYRLQQLDPSVLVGVLSPLVPGATMAVDTPGRALVVTGRARDHATIGDAVAKLEGDDTRGDAPQLQTYATDAIDADNLLLVLQNLFVGRVDVRLSLDRKTDKLVAWARPAQHETIAAVIDQIRGESAPGAAPQVEVYSLDGADADFVASVLNTLTAKMPDVQIVPDPRRGQIMALARPEQHATIRATIEQMRSAAPEVEVIQLQVIDAFQAEMAIEQLFGGDSSTDANVPKVDSDTDTGQLFIRGSKQQIAQIRQLLVKMGEPAITSAADSAGRRLRLIPITGGSAQAALREIERLWPQLRRNPIRVVTPSAVAPSLRSNAPNTTPAPQPPPSETPAPQPDDSSQRDWADGLLAQATIGDDGEPPPRLPVARPGPPHAPETKAEQPSEAEPPDDTPPPIIVAPGPRGITIASDDVEALDEFESLLRTLTGRRGGGMRELRVFSLASANALIVADTLQRLFREGFFGYSSSGSAKIVADQRLNALIVNASGNDLQTIEELLQVLDSADVPDTLVANKPRVIPVLHTEASEIADVIRDIYRTQLSPSGVKRQIPAPSGVSREVAALISQINSASTGPEMSLGIDSATNSLVISAPPPLFEEVQQLVRQLDESASESGRTVRVIQLEKLNTKAVQQALELIMQRRTSRER